MSAPEDPTRDGAADGAQGAETAAAGAGGGPAGGSVPFATASARLTDPFQPTVEGPAQDRPAAGDEHHHADVSGGWLRPAVFGAMDGLVTNIALITGVGGGGISPHNVVLTGFAGLVAGAISMGLGEYTSVRTQNDQIAFELAKERRELELHPDAEAEELAGMWIARGLPPDLARQVATAFGQNPDAALRLHAQEELGVNPSEQPSPWVAAGSSFLCFSAGALVPLLSYLAGAAALWLSVAVGGVGLFVAGALTARFTSRSWYLSGLRQLALGLAAAGATFLIGRAVGVSGIG